MRPILLILFLLVGSSWWHFENNEICFQSAELKNLDLIASNNNYVIEDDSGKLVKVIMFEDSSGLLYWYRRLNTPVCLTGECKLIDIGIFWKYNGDFLGLEVYNEHLTKTDHTIFSDNDYDKLISVLQNDWSILREYEADGLLNENYEEIDATSGATKKEIAEETVTGAVYTTYTIWHLSYVGENEQLILLTLEQLTNSEKLKQFIASKDKSVHEFLLRQTNAGYLATTSELKSFIIQSLNSSDLNIRNLAIQSLVKLDLSEIRIQNRLAKLYLNADSGIKRRVISALKPVQISDYSLHCELENDLNKDNIIFAIEVLRVLANSKFTTDKATNFALYLSKEENVYAQKVATEYLLNHKN